ncbi:MAG: hypothetical protein ABSE66_10055 [Thermoplasmata archaeon]|jgi:hypothetical protein
MVTHLILAGSYEQYCHWLDLRQPWARPETARYVPGPESLRGLQADKDHTYVLIKYGTWRERADAEAIRGYAESHGFFER